MKRALAIACMAAAVSSHAYAAINNLDPDMQISLARTEALAFKAAPDTAPGESTERVISIKQEAYRYGFSAGHLARWAKIRKKLSARAGLLSQIFDFKLMYLEGGTLQPPVLDVGSNIESISKDGTMRKFIHKTYRVIRPARFVSKPLTWQHILLPDTMGKLADIEAPLRAKNAVERAIWKENIEKGWRAGMNAANNEFSMRLTTLYNAYKGMLIYAMLSMQGMVAAPNVQSGEHPTATSKSGDTLSIGVENQTIARGSYFVDKPYTWKPIIYAADFYKDD